MPAERSFGMDHNHYDWSPFTKRGVLRWPEGARVALCVIVNLERFEWQAPEASKWLRCREEFHRHGSRITCASHTVITATGLGFFACWTSFKSMGSSPR